MHAHTSEQLTTLCNTCVQALIYPLTVASKSASSARHNAANQILKNMCEHSQQLVQQAVMVCTLLKRLSTHFLLVFQVTEHLLFYEKCLVVGFKK